MARTVRPAEIQGFPSSLGQRRTNSRNDTMLTELMAAEGVHPELIAAPIHESSQPDVLDLVLCDALIRYCRQAGARITS